MGRPLLLLASSLLAPACLSSSQDGEVRDGMALIQFKQSVNRTSGVPTMHSIYTVGCDLYQLEQAVVLDHSFRKVGHEGKLTRIVCGCKTEEDAKLLKTSVLESDPHFAVFVSEGDLMEVPGGKGRYPARSRPHAIQQWLDAVKPTEKVISILDPDFVFQQPLSSHPDLAKVAPGTMLAQMYDLGLDYIEGFKAAGEEAPELSWDTAMHNYSTGPPWVLHQQDLRTMLPDWSRYTDAWPAEKGLLREQDAFCMSALRHKVASIGQNNFMISNPDAWNEDWSDKAKTRGAWAPYVLHYCSTYQYGSWYFYKSLISDGYYVGSFGNSLPSPFACNAPLMQLAPEPPSDEEDLKSYKMAWMMWKLFPSLNEAYTEYRSSHCGAGGKASGFVRTMLPKQCPSKGVTTRYRVAPDAVPAWKDFQAHGGDTCGEAAQNPVM